MREPKLQQFKIGFAIAVANDKFTRIVVVVIVVGAAPSLQLSGNKKRKKERERRQRMCLVSYSPCPPEYSAASPSQSIRWGVYNSLHSSQFCVHLFF